MKIFDFKSFKKINENVNLKNWTIKDYIEWVLEFPIIKAFILEGKDYKNMAKIFSVLLMDKLNINHRNDIPSSSEIKDAIQQLKSIPKIMPFCALLLLPIPGLLSSYMIVAFLIHKITGGEVNILPQNFNLVMEDLAKKKIFKMFSKKKDDEETESENNFDSKSNKL